MIKKLGLFIFLSLALSSVAQQGFITHVQDSLLPVYFNNLLIQNDTILVLGRTFKGDNFINGIRISAFDTLGNALFTREYFDEQGDDYILEDNYSLIKCRNGYAITGNLWDRNWGILLKLDDQFNKVFVTEYPDSTIVNTRQRRVIELPDGYLLAGTKQRHTFDTDIYAMKVDTLGNLVWERFFGTTNTNETIRRVIQIDDEEHWLIGNKGGGHNSSDLTKSWSDIYLINIDGLGQVKKEFWIKTDDLDGIISDTDIYIEQQDTVIMFGCALGDINQYGDSFISQHRLMGISTNGEIIYETPIGDWNSLSYLNYDRSCRVVDDGFLLAGQMEEFPEEGRLRPPTIFKFDLNGDSLWHFRNDMDWSLGDHLAYETTGMEVMPSGSIVACGYVRYLGTNIQKGFLLKIDKNGCLIPGCRETSSVKTDEVGDIDIFPNPARDVVNVKVSQPATITLNDLQGRIVLDQPLTIGQNSINIPDTAKFSVLLYRIEGDGWLKSGKLVIYD